MWVPTCCTPNLITMKLIHPLVLRKKFPDLLSREINTEESKELRKKKVLLSS